MNQPDDSQERRPWWRRRLPRLLLVVGAALAILPLLPRIPQEQTLLFRFNSPGVERFEVSWTPIGEREALGGVSYSFPEGGSRDVRHHVSLPNGEYLLAIVAERAQTEPLALPSDAPDNTPETSYVRRVSLEGGETVIPLSLPSTSMARKLLAP